MVGLSRGGMGNRKRERERVKEGFIGASREMGTVRYKAMKEEMWPLEKDMGIGASGSTSTESGSPPVSQSVVLDSGVQELKILWTCTRRV